jgi:hypothetical protein
VHEGPARISKLGGVALKRGMILSNRQLLQNRRLWHPHRKSGAGDRGASRSAPKTAQCLQTLTLAPIDGG